MQALQQNLSDGGFLMVGPCLCGDTFCPNCGGECPVCHDAGKEECDCPSMYADEEYLEKFRKSLQEEE